jgi:hypothetical protein
MRNLITLLLIKYSYNNQVKEDEKGRACSMDGETRDAYRILVGEHQKEKDR